MKRNELDCLLRNLSQGNKDEVVNAIRRAAASEYRKNPTGSWGTILEGYAAKIENRRGMDAKMLTLLSPSKNTHASMAAFEERAPSSTLNDIILAPDLEEKVKGVLEEHHAIEDLAEANLRPQCRILLIGGPGTGKTMLANILAKETGKPFFTLRMGTLMESTLGSTIRNIENSFTAIAQTNGVFLFDEFDALASARGDSTDVNEMRRALNALLICFENHQGPSIVVAATNRPDSMDSAFRRRFDSVWKLPDADQAGRVRIVSNTLLTHNFPNEESVVKELAGKLGELSYDECEDITRKLIVRAVLSKKKTIDLGHIDEIHRFAIG